MHVVRYGSTDDLSNNYSVTIVPSAETDAVVLIAPDKVPTSVVEPGGNTQGTLYVAFTPGSLSAAIIRIYDAYIGQSDGTTLWFQETIESDTLGVATLYPYEIVLTASSNISYSFPIPAVQAMKFTVQASGTTTGSAIKLTVAMRSN